MRKSIIQRTPTIKNPIENTQIKFRKITIKGKTYEVRRLCIPLISLTCLLGIPALYNFVYLPLVIFMVTFILFWSSGLLRVRSSLILFSFQFYSFLVFCSIWISKGIKRNANRTIIDAPSVPTKYILLDADSILLACTLPIALLNIFR